MELKQATNRYRSIEFQRCEGLSCVVFSFKKKKIKKKNAMTSSPAVGQRKEGMGKRKEGLGKRHLNESEGE